MTVTESVGRPATCQIVSHLDIRRDLVGRYGSTSIYRMTCQTCGAGWQLREERS